MLGCAPPNLCLRNQQSGRYSHSMRYRRAWLPGGTYFFTVVAHDRRPILTDPTALGALRAAFRRELHAGSLRLDAIVILPDHLHCLWTQPPDDADFARPWQRIKATVSRAVADRLEGPRNASRRSRGERGIWQRRYWEHAIRDEADLARHIDYIHFNPVRHGLVQSPSAWPHSTFARFVAREYYPVDWATDPGDLCRE